MHSRLPITALATFILSNAAATAQWTSYTNFDAASQIAFLGNRAWAATSGGGLAYDLTSHETIKLTNIEGLGSTALRCVTIDTADNVWYGSPDGWLSRVSPSLAIRNFAVRDSSGLIGRPVAINDLEIEGDRIWFANDLGVSKFLIYSNGGEIRDTARRLGALPFTEDALAVRLAGANIWAITSRGVAFIDKDNTNIQFPGNWRSFAQGENGLTNADARAIAVYRDTVLLGTASGVFKFTTSPDTFWVPIGLQGDTITALFASDTLVVAATVRGVHRLGATGWTAYPSGGLVPRQIGQFEFAPDGSFWAATQSGLGELAAGAWVLHVIPGPASNIVNKISIDSMGGIWMTHDSRGLTRFFGSRWRVYNVANSDPDGTGPLRGLRDNVQTEVTVAPGGDVWASSYGGGLYHFHWADSSWFLFTEANSPMYGVFGNHAYWAATGVKADPAGNIWVTAFASDSSLIMGIFAPYSPDSTWQLFKGDEIGLGPVVYAQTFLFDGDIAWVGRGDGLDRFDHGGTPFDPSDDEWTINITNVNVFDMELDNNGVLWLATSLGLHFLPPFADSIASLELPTSISGIANAVQVDGAGNIWVGTVAGMGVLRPDSEDPSRSRWTATYTTANSPILNNKVNGIAVDIPTGTIYIGTDGGLSIFESGILPPSPDLADMSAFPNPVVLGAGETSIEFKRVPSSGTLTIFTASGDIVARLDLSRTSSWNLRNEAGKRIAGGIYFFHVTSGEASGTGKFAVIR
jgi:ligand-binding sensor domain-containing protein